MTPTAVLLQAAGQAPAPQGDSFGTKELIIILANLAIIVGVTLWGRNHGSSDRENERIWDEIRSIKDRTIPEVQHTLFEMQLDIRDIKGLTEPLKEAVRLNLAGLVPRSNPLREETNRMIIRWQMGDFAEPEKLDQVAEELLEAADEVMYEAHEDPKLTPAERVTFSLTGASMHYEAIKALNARERQANPCE